MNGRTFLSEAFDSSPGTCHGKIDKKKREGT